MPKHRPTEMSLVDSLRLLADDPNVTSVRWGEDYRELVLREGRYVVEVLKRRNRLLPVTVFSTLAEKMVQHGFLWTDSRVVEGDVEHSFEMENTKQDTETRRAATSTDTTSSSSIPDESPAESARPPATFLWARRRVSSTMLVDCHPWPGQIPDCHPWPGHLPGSSPELSDDELTSFLGEARPNSREEEEMVMQLERSLQDDASGSLRSGLVTLASPEDVGSSDLSAFVVGKTEVEQQDVIRKMARTETHEETDPGTWLFSPVEVLDSNTAPFEVGSVAVLERDEEELLRKMLTAHRQEGLVVCPPAVCDSTVAISDVITSIVQEEEEMRMMTSSPGSPFSPYDKTFEERNDIRLREEMPIIIQEANFTIPEMRLTDSEDQDLSNAKKQKLESPSFLTQILAEHQNLYLGDEIRQSTVPPTGPLYSEESGLVSPSQLLEDPYPTSVSPEYSATPANSTDSFVDLLEYAGDSHFQSTAEHGAKRRRTEKWTTVERVDLVEAPSATRAYSPHTETYQRRHVDRQPAIEYVYTTKHKLVEEMLENAAKSRQCEEPGVFTDISDMVAGDDGASPQLSYLDQLFHEEIETPCPATTTEFVPGSPSLQSHPAVTSTGRSPEEDPTADMLAAIAELVDDMTDADSQPETENVRHPSVTIATASEQEDASRCHGNQVCWDFPPDFSTLRAIWMEDWPLDHGAEQTDVSEQLS